MALCKDASISLLIAGILLLLNAPMYLFMARKYMETFYTGATPESAIPHTNWVWNFFCPFLVLHGGIFVTFYMAADQLFLSGLLWIAVGISEIVWAIWFITIAAGCNKGYNSANPTTFKKVMIGSYAIFGVFGLVALAAGNDCPTDSDFYEKYADLIKVYYPVIFPGKSYSAPTLEASGFKIILLIFGLNFLAHSIVFFTNPALLWETFYIGKFPEDSKDWLNGFVFKFWGPWTFQTGLIYFFGFLAGGFPPNACIANGVGAFAGGIYILLSVLGLEGKNYLNTKPGGLQKMMSASWVLMLSLFGVLSFLAYDADLQEYVDKVN